MTSTDIALQVGVGNVTNVTKLGNEPSSARSNGRYGSYLRLRHVQNDDERNQQQENRAAAEVRLAVTKNGGTMADPGSVSYLFARKGVITVSKTAGMTEDSLLELILDHGVENIEDRGEAFVITTEPSSMVDARAALQAAGIDYESADSEFVSSMMVPVDSVENANKVIKLIDALEDSDDVQNVYTNVDFTPEVLAALEAE